MDSASLMNRQPTAAPLRQDAGIIGLVGMVHLVSHFSQLLLAPLFPWLKTEFGVSYTELGFLMTIFFVVSCTVQTASGFVVDRLGPLPVMFSGLALIGLAAFGYAWSTSYWMLAGFAVVGGLGNGVFHPVNYTLLNRRVSASRLGHAYSVHGITGSLGWALAPALLLPLTVAYSWRVALMAAGLLAFGVLAVLACYRKRLAVPPPALKPLTNVGSGQSNFDFLRLPALWMCFGFFFWYALILGVVQAFAPEAARQLHAVPLSLVAWCLTVYMLSSASGMVLGGFLAARPERCERVVAIGFGVAALASLYLALGHIASVWVPVLFGLMGATTGIAGPSRDLLIKRATPDNASGRVYGVVYAGLDIGQAISPLIFGALMDQGAYRVVLLSLALMQGVLVLGVFKVERVRKNALCTA